MKDLIINEFEELYGIDRKEASSMWFALAVFSGDGSANEMKKLLARRFSQKLNDGKFDNLDDKKDVEDFVKRWLSEDYIN